MSRIIVFILIASMGILGISGTSQAKLVTIDEAQEAAENWIKLIIEKKGSWGGENDALVEEIKELKQDGRTIGYVAQVYPQGYIVLSLRKELAPIKAYSAAGRLDPDRETGVAGLIKERMKKIVTSIEDQLGALDKISSEALAKVLVTNHQSKWDELIGDPVGLSDKPFSDMVVKMNYQSGDHLISSSWHQSEPYNDMVPDGNCTENSNGNYKVGCVATAAAQIMHYWNWPPYGAPVPLFNDRYDWANMPDRIWTTSPQAEIDAVAELNAEAAAALFMDFGCAISWALYSDIAPIYRDRFRYSGNAWRRPRSNYGFPFTPEHWFALIKTELNLNRPLQYQIKDHSIVCDGWQEIGDPPLRQYHMNYGWSWECEFTDGCNTWYTLDNLHQIPGHGGDIYDESIVTNIYPAQSLGSTLTGTYETNESFPYYYFDQDATGHSASFQSGQFLQFLEGIIVTNTSTSGGTFRFEGDLFGSTVLFTGGDTSRGIKIDSGQIVLSQNGAIRFDRED